MKKVIILIFFIIILSHIHAQNPWLGKDKIAHYSIGAFLTYWSFGINKDILHNNQNNSLIISVSFTTLMGFGKEYSDKKIVKSDWSWHDIVYDFAGICTGLVLINNLR